jgi:hypothetical protein
MREAIPQFPWCKEAGRSNMETLKTLGQIAGIGGIALGIFLLLYRDAIRRLVLSRLPATESYKIMRLFLILVWSVAVIGMLIWATEGLQVTFGPGSPISNQG